MILRQWQYSQIVQNAYKQFEKTENRANNMRRKEKIEEKEVFNDTVGQMRKDFNEERIKEQIGARPKRGMGGILR